MRTKGVLIAIGALGVITLSGAQAHAALSCGKTVTKDVKLRKDLKNCPGDGLEIGASGITVDLNGHKIDGQGSTGAGINAIGNEDVIIKGGGGGRITQFDVGVDFLSTDNSRVSGIKVDDVTSDGIFVNSASSTELKNNTITEADDDGISVSHSVEIEISDNAVTGPATTPFGSTGITVNASDSADNVVEDNVVKGGEEGDWGIQVNGSAQATRVKGNTARGFQQYGIQIYDGSDDTAVRKNRAIGNGLDGIRIEDTAGTGTSVVRNLAEKNDDDGIEVADSLVGVGDNTANDNGDWGIVADQVISDLGGNKAKGNGQPSQCIGVSCS